MVWFESMSNVAHNGDEFLKIYLILFSNDEKGKLTDNHIEFIYLDYALNAADDNRLPIWIYFSDCSIQKNLDDKAVD